MSLFAYGRSRPPWRGGWRVFWAVVMLLLCVPVTVLMVVGILQSLDGAERSLADALFFAGGALISAPAAVVTAWVLYDAIVRRLRHDPPWPEPRNGRRG